MKIERVRKMKQQLETSELQKAICPFCGQLFFVETIGFRTKEQLEEDAVLKCDCNGATEYRVFQKEKEKVNRFLEDLEKVNSEAMEYLQKGLEYVRSGILFDFTLNIDGETKIKVSKNTEEKIGISKTFTKKKKITTK